MEVTKISHRPSDDLSSDMIKFLSQTIIIPTKPFSDLVPSGWVNDLVGRDPIWVEIVNQRIKMIT